MEDKKRLTAKQENILKIAFEKGYFEHPKKITHRRLAKIVGIPPATLAEILGRGQKLVLQQHFKGRLSVLGKRNYSHLP